MTRRHTDRPIPPIAPLRPLPSPSAVTTVGSDRAARTSLRTAQAFYRRKLRDWAKARRDAGISPPSDETDDQRDRC